MIIYEKVILKYKLINIKKNVIKILLKRYYYFVLGIRNVMFLLFLDLNLRLNIKLILDFF